MLAPVVAGVDGCAESLAAAEWAAREAVRRGRELRLVHAWNRYPRARAGAAADAVRRHAGRNVLRRAEQRVRAACPEVRLRDEQVAGPATTALLAAAGTAELLVLGSRGLSGFTGFLVGSVALGVVARATCPVVLVRAGEQAADEHLPSADGGASVRTAYRDVVVGVDVEYPCDELLEFAFAEARSRHARLKALHAWRATGPLTLGPGEIGLLDEPRQAGERQDLLAGVLRVWRDKYPDVEVLERVVPARPASALVRAASGAGLVVVGRRVTEDASIRRTGPVAHAVIHHAGCPVAVVPHY
ncbi:universal stress protein [Streptomyces fumanus]|uniref:universal stress protein n=1 Tax=Streptomyces fumanus TaxID=67302 RepID=UPI003410910A